MAEDFLVQLDKLLKGVDHIELKNIDILAEEFTLNIMPQMVAAIAGQVAPALAIGVAGIGPANWIDSKFRNPSVEFESEIETITFKRSGRGGKEVKIGGEKVLPFMNFLSKKNPNRPVVSLDVFDTDIGFPKPIKNQYHDVFGDMAAWAKRAVDKFGADMVTVHLLSSDPGRKDVHRTPKECAKSLEDVMQAVKVPFIIGGSGNKTEDPLLFQACGEVAEAEISMLSAVDDATYEKIIPFAKKMPHNVLLWTQLDMNNQKKLNRDVLGLDFPRNRIVMDPTTATLGYGLEFSFSIYQRNRIAGLKGDKELNFPMSGGTTNGWGAREAWMSEKDRPEWGDRELRGPMWEIINALSLMLNGNNISMMFHPVAARFVKKVATDFFTELKKELPPIENWVTMKN
jgi:acetyl-CoA decarbonylase/synthase complex subunit delta